MEHQREVFYKETMNGSYYPFVYWWGTFLQEIPFNLVAVIVYVTIYYFLIGLASNSYGYFILSYLLISFTSIIVGQCIAIYSPNQQVSQLVAPVISSLMLLLTGFLIPKPDIPNYMIWLYWANPFSYAFNSLSSGAWHQEVSGGCGSNHPHIYILMNDRSLVELLLYSTRVVCLSPTIVCPM